MLLVSRNLLLVILIAISANAASQSKKATSVKDVHLQVFEQAMLSGDAHTATISLNYYLANPLSTQSYGDTLAILYMQQGAYAPCYYWAQKRLRLTPDNNNLLELKGICLEKMQQPKEAIEVFDRLFKKTQSPYHAYKLLELQYGMKRLAECLATALAAEKLGYKPSFMMTYNAGQQLARTYLQAGVYNIHALALYDLDRKAEAKTYFEKALALDTGFVLAKQNLAALNSLDADGSGKRSLQGKTPEAAWPANKQNDN